MNGIRFQAAGRAVATVLGLCAWLVCSASPDKTDNLRPGFRFDCDNTSERPCRKLTASEAGRPVPIESSSAVWSERYGKVLIVSDNFNELEERGAGHYVVAYFDPLDESMEIPVEPLLTPEQVERFRLYDLEGVTLLDDRLYAIGSLALHGKDPERDRWERHQFIRMDLEERGGYLTAVNLTHVTERWPNFRDWLISKSGVEWSGAAIRGRAEGEGINVEALSATDHGTLLIGFRGPLAAGGGSLALEIRPPEDPGKEPETLKLHVIPPVDLPHLPEGAAKTLRAIGKIPDEPGQYFVLLGPKGYEKEALVLARWDATSAALDEVTLLPEGFVAEGVSTVPGDRILVVDDLDERVLFATQPGRENEAGVPTNRAAP